MHYKHSTQHTLFTYVLGTPVGREPLPSQEGEYTSVKVYAASHAWSDTYTK